MTMLLLVVDDGVELVEHQKENDLVEAFYLFVVVLLMFSKTAERERERKKKKSLHWILMMTDLFSFGIEFIKVIRN